MKRLLEELRSGLLDPQAGALTDTVEWWSLPSLGVDDPFPVAVLGEGDPLLLLHGFDSSCLEFRRTLPKLEALGVEAYVVLGVSATDSDAAMVFTPGGQGKRPGKLLVPFWVPLAPWGPLVPRFF